MFQSQPSPQEIAFNRYQVKLVWYQIGVVAALIFIGLHVQIYF